MFNLFNKKSSYLCVLHFRRQKAFRGPSDPPFIESYAVAYNGKINNNFCKCTDDGETVEISISNNDISLVFPSYTKPDAIKIPYKPDEICRYHVPIMDAMESWEFIVSNEPVNHEIYKPGYIKSKLDGTYFNIEEISDEDKLKYILEVIKSGTITQE